jgi:hypothetical protein
MVRSATSRLSWRTRASRTSRLTRSQPGALAKRPFLFVAKEVAEYYLGGVSHAELVQTRSRDKRQSEPHLPAPRLDVAAVGSQHCFNQRRDFFDAWTSYRLWNLRHRPWRASRG